MAFNQMRSSGSTTDLNRLNSGGNININISNGGYSNQQLNAILSPIKSSPSPLSSSSMSNSSSYSNLNTLSTSKSFNSLTLIENQNDTTTTTTGAISEQYQQLLSMIPKYQTKQYESDVKILFERNTPEQMKQMEFKKRSEIEDMKSQLRNLIGNKYRDLVEGSDSIVKMKKSTELISENLSLMQSELKQFSEKRNHFRKGVSQDNLKLNKEKEIQKKISIFSKYCKFLIDIPEVIWRSLDSNDYFEVCVFFLKSKYLYSKITNENNLEIKRLLSKLTIIEKQWISMKQFPIKTIGYSKLFLNESTSRIIGTPIEKYIGSLSTLILFEKKSIKETFNEFLLSRRSVLFNSILSKDTNRPIQQTIEKMFHFLKMSIYYIMVLFYPRKYQTNNNNNNNNNDDQPEEEEEQDDEKLISNDYQSKISKFKSNLQQYTSSLSSMSSTTTTNSQTFESKMINKPVSEKELNQLPTLNFTSSILESTFNWRSPYLKECLKFYKDVSNGELSINSSGSQQGDDYQDINSNNNNNNSNNNSNSGIDSQDIEYSLIEFDNFNSNFIFKRTSEWIEEIIEDFKSNLVQKFLIDIKSAKELSSLRSEIFDFILDFKNIVPFIQPPQTNSLSSSNSSINSIASPSVSLTSPTSSPIITTTTTTTKATVLTTPTPTPTPISWNRMFSIICGKDMKYFLNIFEDIFLVKSESIIMDSFSRINLSKIQSDIFSHIKSEDKNFSEFLWFYNQDDPIQSIKNKTNGITPSNELFLTKINQLYNNIKSDFIYLLNDNNININNNNNNNRSMIINSQPKNLIKINEILIKEYMKKSFYKSLNEFTTSTQDRIDQLILLNKNKTTSGTTTTTTTTTTSTNLKRDEILFISKLSKIFYKHIVNNANLYFLNPLNIFDTTNISNCSTTSFSKSNSINILDTISSPPQPPPSPSPTHSSPSIQRHTNNNNNTSPIINNNNNSEILKESLPIIDKLKQQFYYGCIVWVNEFVGDYSQILKQDLFNHDWNDSDRVKTWEKHIIQIESNGHNNNNNNNNASGGGDDDDVTLKGVNEHSTIIYIPYQTSPFITSYLMSISLEISKFSLNTIDKNILKFIIESITLNLFNIVNDLLSTSTTASTSNLTSNNTTTTTITTIKFNKEGYIQLLIDLKYIGFILFGRELNSSSSKKPTSQPTSNVIIKDSIFKKAKSHYQSIISTKNNPDENIEQQQQQQQEQLSNNIVYTFNQIIELVEKNLDPIDLAFYNSYIVKFIDQTYSKTLTLFGNFVYLHKSIVKPEKKQQSINGGQQSPPLATTTTSGSNSKGIQQQQQQQSDLPNPMQLLKTNTKFQLFSIDTIQTITDAIATAPTTIPSSTSTSTSNSIQSSANNSAITSPISTIDYRNQQQQQQQNNTNQQSLPSILSPTSASSTINTFSFMGKKISDLMYNTTKK
ncbi:hypothetical protein ACTFIW_002314 [Dictyostelium discoideum]